MRQRTFETIYQPFWDNFANQLENLENTRKKDKTTTPQKADFPANYQTICQHLAIAEARAYSPLLITRLRQLVQRGHQLLYQHRSNLLQRILQFIDYGFPQNVRAQKGLLITTTLLFYGTGLLAALINIFFPDFIYLFMSPYDVQALERMYDPALEWVGPLSRRGSDQDWAMFGYYIFNNIGIAFTTFASGLLVCLGTLFYLVYNALIMGLVACHLSLNGYGQTFWPFVITHGAFELTAITLAASAGLKLGLAVLVPKRKTRLDSVRYAASQAINLVLGAFIMLLIAAFIEAYWSSMNTSPTIRYLVGTICWILVYSYFLFAGRRASSYESY